ncbi:MAG: 30S ribosomal protein S20 [Atribacterota bacterium]|nr:30S ribosomal protein S20 [Atribacterota bacterium]MDD4895569.1 30S ribosomal protein S20 [Atribacterota bacterium]MDD5636249.1 30S ribosomal protein S20 [Atribacterota bacterium]
MPIIKSAIKRVKISEKQHQRNFAYKSKVKTLIKKFENSLSTENNDVLQQYYNQCVSALDKAAQKGILAKNTVARKKSLLSKKFKLQAQSAKTVTNQDDEKK